MEKLSTSRLDELAGCLSQERVIVQMHNYPDQDALASAMGLKVLLEAKGKKVEIGYEGIVDKDNTLKMIELLGIEICPQDELGLTPDDEIIIVDGQKGNINMTDFVGSEVACIDHHRVRYAETYKFQDIRSEVGACASIIASYFFENDVEMPQNVATALLYGIKMDTHNMTRGVSLWRASGTAVAIRTWRRVLFLGCRVRRRRKLTRGLWRTALLKTSEGAES